MRWKALFLGKDKENQDHNHHYGFKSRSCPTQHPDLISFENDLLAIKKVSFKNGHNNLRLDIII